MQRRSWARRGTKAALSRLAGAAGYDLVPRSFYSPIPAPDALSPDLLGRRSAMRGIELDLDDCLERLSGLAPFLAEFEPPRGFAWGNGMYDTVEADVLHAIVRSRKPQRLLELGSGFSSLIIDAAIRRNELEGRQSTEYTIYDPYPRDFVRGLEGAELRAVSATETTVEELRSLEAGDILFVDTTHTVKAGSEVNHIVLDLLPELRPGVLVHVHDIFLPFEYPRSFFEKGLYWNEQYLLQAFLSENPNWAIFLPLYALVRERFEEVAALVSSANPRSGPGAFWIERV